MTFKPVRKLTVTRTLTTGQAVMVGVLAQNRQGVFFQYDADYLGRYGNLSPFGLKATTELQLAPKRPHSGLHGLFGDSLPDGWGWSRLSGGCSRHQSKVVLTPGLG